MHTIKNKHNKLLKAVMSLAIIAGAAGAATGTFAWYSYKKEVNVLMSGTTIRADKQIQVGLRCKERPFKMVGDQKHYFEEDYSLGQISIQENVMFRATDNIETDSFTVYWIKGDVNSILKNYQENYSNSAFEKIKPITSGKYQPGDKETSTVGSWTGFKGSPDYSNEATYKYTELESGDKENYFYLPLAFRVLENELVNNQESYAHNESIYLSKFVATDLTHKSLENEWQGVSQTAISPEIQQQLNADMAKAVRVKVDYPSELTKGKNFIFDPNKEEDNELPVGGVLNLNPDDVFDYDRATGRQIPYGQFDSEKYYKVAATTEEPTIHMDEVSTFHANNLKGGFELDFSEGKTKPSICYTKGSIVNEDRIVDDSHVDLVKTSTDANMGFVDLSIYLEGWDRNIIDVTVGRAFNFDLEFSIAKDRN